MHVCLTLQYQEAFCVTRAKAQPLSPGNWSFFKVTIRVDSDYPLSGRVPGRGWQNSAGEAEQTQGHLQTPTFSNNQKHVDKGTGQTIAYYSQKDEDSETLIQVCMLIWLQVSLKACEAKCIHAGAVNSRRKQDYRGEAVLLFATLFRHRSPSKKEEA